MSVRDDIEKVGDLKSIPGELVRYTLTSPGECSSLRLYLRMEDPRSTSDELVRDL